MTGVPVAAWNRTRAKAEARLGEAERLSPTPRSTFDKVVLLAGIGVLVAGLLALTVRLVRGVPEPAPPPEKAPGTPT